VKILSEINPDLKIDVRGKSCPMPVIETKRAIKKININQILEVIADDRASLEDIPRWCKRTGNQLLNIKDDGDGIHFFIKRLK